MARILKLKNSIMINGKEVSEVSYDVNEITGVLFATAEAKKKAGVGLKNVSISVSAEFDFGLHLYLGYAAVIAVNPAYDFSDMERIKGQDVVEIMHIGRNFMMKSEESSAQSDSDEPAEITQESITQAPSNSSESESLIL